MAAARATTTDGNNCIAYADLAAPDGFGAGDVLGKITAPGAFDYTYNHKQAASDPTNLQNSLVGMFFHVNWLHDRWYEAGFDEASGNAQKDNFGRGGIGGDPILAEGNDFRAPTTPTCRRRPTARARGCRCSSSRHPTHSPAARATTRR